MTRAVLLKGFRFLAQGVLFTVTGEELRCDVIVDKIQAIEIETTTHELYLDDSPEEFVMRAVNDEGRWTMLMTH